MQPFKLCATLTAMLCLAPLTASHAQSTNEVFAPKPSSFAYNDGKAPTTGSFAGLGYEVISGYAVAEGDMVLGRVDGHGNILGNANRGLGQSRVIDRWENGVIPYQYNDGISEEERSLAELAIEHWETNTSISLVEITDDNADDYEHYLLFETSNSCASYVGRIGGEQQLWISASCGVGSIIHEIGHAVGLFHEHTRADRDNFISVQWNNIITDKEFNFDVLNSNVEPLGAYDYGSIMHYGESFFTKNGEKTIVVLDGVSQIGQRDALSETDIQSVNQMYATDLALTVTAGGSNETGELNANINVSNQGELGANALSLSLQLEDGGSWVATSQNPGWDCIPNDTLLVCTRDTLEAASTSVFAVAAQTATTSEPSLIVELTSNTFDTDLSNNGHNAIVTEQSVQTNAAEDQGNTNEQSESTNGESPEFAEQENETQSETGETLAEENEPADLLPTIGEQNVQQSSQPIASTVANNSAPGEPNELGAALPETELAAALPSASGGAMSPLGAVVLFLLTFSAGIRRAKHN